MANKTFSERLNIALDKEGFPPKNRGRIQLLAEMVGLSHRGASKWVNGETRPPLKKYTTLAKKLNVREKWLRDGEGSMLGDHIHHEELNKTVEVPVYLAENFHHKDPLPVKTITCNIAFTGDLFAMLLESEAMSPRFPKGSIVIFDREKEAVDGDFVLVNFESYPTPVFRQLLDIGSSIYLDAHNPKFDRLLLSDESKIHGVMIQAILSFT